MALAQDTPIPLLDEPTTYPGIANQIELMDLFTRLNQRGKTLIAVPHAGHATNIIVMRKGRVLGMGSSARSSPPPPLSASTTSPESSSTTPHRHPARRALLVRCGVGVVGHLEVWGLF